MNESLIRFIDYVSNLLKNVLFSFFWMKNLSFCSLKNVFNFNIASTELSCFAYLNIWTAIQSFAMLKKISPGVT